MLYIKEFKVNSKEEVDKFIDKFKSDMEKELDIKLIKFGQIHFRKERSGELYGTRFYINNIESNKSLRINWTSDYEIHSVDIWTVKHTVPKYTIYLKGEDIDVIYKTIQMLLEGNITNKVKLAEDEKEIKDDEYITDEAHNKIEQYRQRVLNLVKNSIYKDYGIESKRKKIDHNEYVLVYLWKLDILPGKRKQKFFNELDIKNIKKDSKEADDILKKYLITIEIHKRYKFNDDKIYLEIQNADDTDDTKIDIYDTRTEWQKVKDKLYYINKNK